MKKNNSFYMLIIFLKYTQQSWWNRLDVKLESDPVTEITATR